MNLIYEPVLSQELADVEVALREAGLLESMVSGLNEFLTLPEDLEVILGECGEPNAFYDPEFISIMLCYELVLSSVETFLDVVETDEELQPALESPLSFIFYHELGHALVDLFDLPITGREEDAVDQLATLILVESGEDGEDAAMDAANWFVLQSGYSELTEWAFADEHSLDEQRFFNIMCWVYGKSPDRNHFIVEEGFLPLERAGGCEDEYKQLSSSWERILSPHLVEPRWWSFHDSQDDY